MKKMYVNFCSENGLALTQVLNLSIYFSLSPNITRIAFFCAFTTGFNLEGLAPPRLILHKRDSFQIKCDKGLCGGLRE